MAVITIQCRLRYAYWSSWQLDDVADKLQSEDKLQTEDKMRFADDDAEYMTWNRNGKAHRLKETMQDDNDIIQVRDMA